MLELSERPWSRDEAALLKTWLSQAWYELRRSFRYNLEIQLSYIQTHILLIPAVWMEQPQTWDIGALHRIPQTCQKTGVHIFSNKCWFLKVVKRPSSAKVVQTAKEQQFYGRNSSLFLARIVISVSPPHEHIVVGIKILGMQHLQAIALETSCRAV